MRAAISILAGLCLSTQAYGQLPIIGMGTGYDRTVFSAECRFLDSAVALPIRYAHITLTATIDAYVKESPTRSNIALKIQGYGDVIKEVVYAAEGAPNINGVALQNGFAFTGLHDTSLDRSFNNANNRHEIVLFEFEGAMARYYCTIASSTQYAR